MANNLVKTATLILALVWSVHSIASEAIVSEPVEDSYNYVSHYRILVKASPGVVWGHLKELRSWMYDFDLSHVSGSPGEQGQVLRLYPEQDFLVQIVSAVPAELLVIANLPSEFRGEFSTGVAVITLNESQGQTIVDLTMSRRYSWQGEDENQMRAVRESGEFLENSRSTWERFLDRLRVLAEGK